MYYHGGVGLRQVRFDGTLLSDLSRNINNIVRILRIRTFLNRSTQELEGDLRGLAGLGIRAGVVYLDFSC